MNPDYKPFVLEFEYTVRTRSVDSHSRFICPLTIMARNPKEAAEKRIRLLLDSEQAYDRGTVMVTSEKGDGFLYEWTREIIRETKIDLVAA